MPRPKRTKITSTTTRVAKTAPPKETVNPVVSKKAKASNAADSFSEDSDGLVTKSRATRPRRRMPREKTPEPVDEADLIMTGALPAAHDVPLPSLKNRTPATDASRRSRATKNTRSSARTSSSSVVIPAREEEVAEGDSSGFGDLTFSSLGSESPAHGTRPPSAIKVGATPAHEASILALTNFKRRARQPSLLRMVQQTTDLEDNDQSGLDDTDDFDFDDFLPQAESTPLNVRTGPEHETRNDSGAQISSSGSRGVKRKLTSTVQVPRSSPPYDPPSGADVESARSPSPSLPEAVPSREEVIAQTQEDQELLSETYAPPMSSSPSRESPISQPTEAPNQRPTRRRGRPAKNAPRYEESDPEETETPAKAKRMTKSKAQQSISTAQLKCLLPRRRNRDLRDRDEFDLESSEMTPVDSDQDELQMPHPRRPKASAGRLTSPKAAKKSLRGRKATTAKASKTYSRRISSDKENEARNNPDEPTEASIAEHSEKLAAIKKKFEEVDAFELEFETVDVTTSSSPFR